MILVLYFDIFDVSCLEIQAEPDHIFLYFLLNGNFSSAVALCLAELLLITNIVLFACILLLQLTE